MNMAMINPDALSNLPTFLSLKPATIQHIARLAQVVSLNAGELLYRQGAPPTGLFALQEGRIKLYRQSRGRVQILAILMPGDGFGAESFSTGAPSPCAATALTVVSAIHIPPDALGQLLSAHADFQELLLELVTNRLKQFVTLVHDLAFRDVTSRLATVLILRAEVEGQPSDEGIIFDRLLSQQEFADMVGTVREVVYRTFKRFEEDGLVRMTRSTILIQDLDTLRSIALQEAR